MITARYIDTSELYYRGQWVSQPHAHHCHELGLCLAGCQGVETGGAEFTVQEGSLVFYPAGTEHREWNAAKRHLLFHYLHFESKDYPVRQPFCLPDSEGRIRMLMDWLFAEKKTHTPLTPDLTQALTCSIAVQLAKLVQYPDIGLVQAIRQYIRSHISNPITLADLARHAGMSKFHFLRTYKKMAGRTPMQDARIIRLETARQMAMTTSRPLKVIAADAGFPDYRRMLHLFRQHLGTTPGKCRMHTRKP